MKPIITALVLVGFLGIAVLGIFVMYHGSGHDAGFDGCIGALVQGVDCPQAGGWASSVGFHLAAFRTFSNAWFGPGIGGLLLILLVSVLVYVFSATPNRPRSFAAFRFAHFYTDYSPLKQRLICWLALHENSPALL